MGNQNVSVAILNSNEIQFEFYGDFSLGGQNKFLNGKFIATRENQQIKISGDQTVFFIDEGTIFTPQNFQTDSFLIKDVIIGITFHWEQEQNQRFKGSLKFIFEKNKITAVNILPIEDYLTSVISSEMSATSSIELLKTHAIISRSWLLAQVKKRKTIQTHNDFYESKFESENELIKWYDREDHTLYDVCGDDHCQRYQGITKIYAHTAQKAVKETRGIVLKYKDEICDTRFSKACGGITEPFENVWEPVYHPYLTSIVDYKFPPDGFNLDLTKEKNAEKWIRSNPPSFCNTQNENVLSQILLDYDQGTKDFYRWKIEYEQEEISKLIRKNSGIDFGKIRDLLPVSRGQSGRLIKLKIVGTKKTLIIGKELEIRKVLSSSHLYSSAFVVDKENIIDGIPQIFKLTGAGWGHGVGLCQIGAAMMSEMGYKFDEILIHYFKDAKIEKIY